jgi:AcrR family transcriptional regulator
MPMASPQRRRNQEPRAGRLAKGERKRQLLGHARQLFATLGYRATTTEMIAAAAGVTEAVLHRHFDGKQALFAEVLREVRATTLDRWSAETAALADPLARLHAIAEVYLASAKGHAAEFQLLHRALLETDDAEVVALLRGFYLDAEAMLARLIAEGQQSGVFRRSLDARVGAWELIRTALGYTLTLPLGIPLYAEADYLPRAIDCLLHCLLKTDV